MIICVIRETFMIRDPLVCVVCGNSAQYPILEVNERQLIPPKKVSSSTQEIPVLSKKGFRYNQVARVLIQEFLMKKVNIFSVSATFEV